MEDRFLRGRQIAFMTYEYFRVTGAHKAVLDYTDLFSISSHGDDIQDFDTRWDQALLSTSEVPKDKNILKVCTGREYESLINSERYWQCTNKKSIKIDRSRIIRS